MNLLAFDTSTETMTLAVRAGHAVLQRREAGGPRASATLIPMALSLLAEAGLSLAQLDAIVFGRGPGSFTGLRTACAVAQGLALGADRPVLPVETLMAVAEAARLQDGADDVMAVLDARMDEVYAARYRHDGQAWQRASDIQLLAPASLACGGETLLAGNAFAAYGDRLPAARRFETIPDALALLSLAPSLLAHGEAVPADQALPLYVRDRVAQTTAEREAARAAGAQAKMTP